MPSVNTAVSNSNTVELRRPTHVRGDAVAWLLLLLDLFASCSPLYCEYAKLLRGVQIVQTQK